MTHFLGTLDTALNRLVTSARSNPRRAQKNSRACAIRGGRLSAQSHNVLAIALTTSLGRSYLRKLYDL